MVRHCPLGCGPTSTDTCLFCAPGCFLRVVCVGTARKNKLKTLSILGDDRGTLQRLMCTERDPQGLVNSASERVVERFVVSASEGREAVYRALVICVPCQPQVPKS